MEKLINMKQARSAHRRQFSSLEKCTNCDGPTTVKQKVMTATGNVIEVDKEVPSNCPVCHGDGMVRVWPAGAPSFRQWVRGVLEVSEVAGKLRKILERTA